MLLNDSKTLDYAVDETARILVLRSLQSAGATPLVLTERRRCFELCFGENSSEKRIEELERQLLAASFEDDATTYTPGELFLESDCVFYITFDEDQGRRVRAGIVYDSKTSNPVGRFEKFCTDVSKIIFKVVEDKSPLNSVASWEARTIPFPQGLARFIARQDEEVMRVATFFEGGRGRTRASSLIAEQAVRTFLRRAQEARIEGYSSSIADRATLLTPIEELVDAGLMQREVRVSCRKTKHPLFDLPSPDALTLITVSRAKCSLCATSVADEVVEEVFNPTNLGLELLEGGNWLRNLVYQFIRDLGVPEYEIAPGPASEHGDSYLVANVSGEPFLFSIRDGELSPSFVRRATSAVGETDARHLVVVVTGVIDEEARMRLYEYAWRRARDGKDVEISIIGKLDDLKRDLEFALERVALRTLARDLFALDASLGTSANRLVMSIFKLWRKLVPERDASGSGTLSVVASNGDGKAFPGKPDVSSRAVAVSSRLLLTAGET